MSAMRPPRRLGEQQGRPNCDQNSPDKVVNASSKQKNVPSGSRSRENLIAVQSDDVVVPVRRSLVVSANERRAQAKLAAQKARQQVEELMPAHEAKSNNLSMPAAMSADDKKKQTKGLSLGRLLRGRKWVKQSDRNSYQPVKQDDSPEGVDKQNVGAVNVRADEDYVLGALPVRKREDKILSLSKHRGERQRIIRRRHWWLALKVSAGVITVLVLLWTLFFSSMFALRTVTVQANSGLINQQLAKDLLLQQKGKSILRLSLGKLSEAIIKQQPAIGKVDISRVYMHGIKVKLSFAVPAAYQITNEGKANLLRADGRSIIVVSAGAAETKGLPQVVVGKVSDQSNQIVIQGLKAIQDLPTQVRKNVISVKAENASTISFILNKGITVIWGDTSNGEIKGEVLKVLMKESGRVYNVSTPKHPTIKK